MDLETLWYEAQPHLYGFAAWAALRNYDSLLSLLLGLGLLALAGALLRARWSYRTQRSSIITRTAWRRKRARPRRALR